MNQLFDSMLDSLEVTPEHRRYLLDYLNALLAKGYYRRFQLLPGLFPIVLTDHNEDNKVANGCAVSIHGDIFQRRIVIRGNELLFVS